MSEKSAKRMRKENPVVPQKPKKSTAEKIVIIVMTVIILAAVGLGSWAVYDQIKQEVTLDNNQSEETTEMTVGQMALEKGIPVEDLLKLVGAENVGITEESTSEELWEKVTLTGFAAFEGMEVEEFKKTYKLENVANDTPWTIARGSVTMGTLAEINNMTFEDFAAAMGLPPEITAETTQDDMDKIYGSN